MHVPFATYTLMRTNLSNSKEPGQLGEPFRDTLVIGKLLHIPQGFNCVHRPNGGARNEQYDENYAGYGRTTCVLSLHAHTAQRR